MKWGLRHRPCISIHAPRAGGDRCCKAIAHKKPYFNPRPPCGGRLPFFVFVFLIMKFQSTPPVRGATSIRGGRKVACEISIHAPRAGGDCRGLVNASDFKTFQSTPPVRGATLRLALRCGGDRISIHAPRAGGDGNRLPQHRRRNISIHAPRAGGDYMLFFYSAYQQIFQSTPPVRGATLTTPHMPPAPMHFNPRPPCGGRRREGLDVDGIVRISIHAPRAGGDKYSA